MKTITKELNLLDVEDIEQALSKYYDREISISEVECSLVYCIPCDTDEPSGMILEFTVDDEFCDSFDVFDENHYIGDKELSLNEPWLPVEEVLNFDVSLFKSFDSYTDNSD